jgi:hypothetical protein
MTILVFVVVTDTNLQSSRHPERSRRTGAAGLRSASFFNSAVDKSRQFRSQVLEFRIHHLN